VGRAAGRLGRLRVLRRHRHPAAARLRRLDERAFLDRHVAIRVDLGERFGAADGCIEA
jgi:hypothetical protein